jgi:dolichol-phosphate mannosyltransferase
VIFVNDGSRDQSLDILRTLAEKESRYRVISFSRNFGHQTAITAGMDYSSGDAVIIMDADLQDPPEVVHQLIAKWKEGYDVVYAVRRSRQDESVFKKFTALAYYRILRFLSQIDIPTDTGDFRLVDRGALESFLSLREGHRFVRGLFSWVGFKQIGIEFDRPGRFAGETHYPLKKMLKLALDGILSFSYVPLRLVMQFGAFVSFLALLLCGYGIIRYSQHHVIPGWTSLFVIIAFFGGVQLLALGMIGEYIGRIHEEIKRRPLYIVRESIGFPESKTTPERTVRAQRHGR